MCRKVTIVFRTALAALVLGVPALAQTAAELRPDWRHIGNSAVEFSLAGLVTGPVERVWYAEDGATLNVRSAGGRVFSSSDFEKWTDAPASAPPASPDPVSSSLPEAGARVRAANAGRLYAIGHSVWRSDNDGQSWSNLTAYRERSILGSGLRDLAVSPANPDDIAVAGDFGVWHSADGGLTWGGLNENLPNLTPLKLLALPGGKRALKISADTLGELEWAPGEKLAWRPGSGAAIAQEARLRQTLSVTLGAPITAFAVAGDYAYAGALDGRLWSSTDQGRNWLPPSNATGAPVEALFVDPQDPRLVLAALGGIAASPRVLRTVNGGAFWDDLSSNLPDGKAHGITADRGTGAVYVATDQGVYMAYADLQAPAPATRWSRISGGLPQATARDVRLDAAGNQLWVAIDGFGVYAAMAPHRLRDPKVVSSADFSTRAAAPGSLLTVLGTRLSSARVGEASIPVLDAGSAESQLQVPFDAEGSTLPLSLRSSAGTLSVGVALRPVSPAIFVATADGAPMVLDADSGLLLDAGNPARSGARIQILATGLGRVRPDWPTGLPAPAGNVPKVIAPVRVYLDGNPIEVTRATLAPGYVGFYLVEAQLPDVVNAGPAELTMEAGGQQSNTVSIHLLP